MPMNFTKLTFDTYATNKIKDVKARLEKLEGEERAKARSAGAKEYFQEMNRQLGIYTSEETAYVRMVMNTHADSKQLVQQMIADAKALEKDY